VRVSVGLLHFQGGNAAGWRHRIVEAGPGASSGRLLRGGLPRGHAPSAAASARRPAPCTRRRSSPEPPRSCMARSVPSLVCIHHPRAGSMRQRLSLGPPAVFCSFPLNRCVPSGEYPGQSGAGDGGCHAGPQHERAAGLGWQGMSRGGMTGQNRRGHGAAEGVAQVAGDLGGAERAACLGPGNCAHDEPGSGGERRAGAGTEDAHHGEGLPQRRAEKGRRRRRPRR